MILNYDNYGTGGKVVVLLHGMAGSSQYWKPVIPYLTKDCRIIAIDLLGFGHSPKPKNVNYDYSVHLQSILETLDSLGIKGPVTLAGHSMGALLALRLATVYPGRIHKLVLIAMPIYSSRQAAHQAITNCSAVKELAYYGWTSHVLCSTWCRALRPLSRRLAPLYLSTLTKEAARDSVLHTWQSYSQSLHHIIENQTVGQDLVNATVPTTILHGDQDKDCLTDSLEPLPKHVTVCTMPGDHQIINTHSKRIARYLQ